MKRILAAACCCFALSCFAQQPPAAAPKAPNAEEMKKIMEMSMGAMVPMMAKMTDAMLEVMLQRGEDPATAKRIARFKRNLYESLMEEGFSSDQALAIMESTGLPAASPSMK